MYDTLDNQSFYTHIELHLNNQSFPPASFVLQPVVYANKQEEILVPFKDRYGRMSPVYARIENSKAGNKVILYAKNVLLCHTEQRLEFFYQKSADVFKDQGNDHEFPIPVTDNRNELAEEQKVGESTMITERTRRREPTIWIHAEKNQMCAALSRNP